MNQTKLAMPTSTYIELLDLANKYADSGHQEPRNLLYYGNNVFKDYFMPDDRLVVITWNLRDDENWKDMGGNKLISWLYDKMLITNVEFAFINVDANNNITTEEKGKSFENFFTVKNRIYCKWENEK